MGSEMCIRDRLTPRPSIAAQRLRPPARYRSPSFHSIPSFVLSYSSSLFDPLFHPTPFLSPSFLTASLFQWIFSEHRCICTVGIFTEERSTHLDFKSESFYNLSSPLSLYLKKTLQWKGQIYYLRNIFLNLVNLVSHTFHPMSPHFSSNRPLLIVFNLGGLRRSLICPFC